MHLWPESTASTLCVTSWSRVCSLCLPSSLVATTCLVAQLQQEAEAEVGGGSDLCLLRR